MSRLPLLAILVAGFAGCAAPEPPSEQSRQAQEAADRPPAEQSREAMELSAPAFRGHTKEIDLVAFSPDYAKLVTVSNGDCTARVWDAQTGRELGQFAVGVLPGRAAVFDVRFTADGQKIVTEHTGGTRFRVWDATTTRLIREVSETDNDTRKPDRGPPGGNGRAASLLHSGNGKRKMENSTRVSVTDVTSGKPVMAVSGKTLIRGENVWAPNYDHLFPGPDGIRSSPSGLAISDDGSLGLISTTRYTTTVHVPPPDPMHPSHPTSETRFIDTNLVLIDLDEANELKRTPLPKEWGSFQLYFFRGKQPFALVSDKDGTTLKLLRLFR